MRRKIELLAPGGDVDSIKAAIAAGADAVFCGLDKFNARNRAANISFDELQRILRLAHKNSCEVYLTLNVIIVESEIPALISLLNKLVNTSLDGVIVQDLGLFYLLNKYYSTLKIHASTQLTTHNKGQIQFLSTLNASRVNLSRELSIGEIEDLTQAGAKHNVLTEVFVHGSYCLSFSGLCYMSSVHGGRSGNRGRCSQPCRERYLTTEVGKDFPLNLKDNSAYFDLKELYNAGVASLKIEGRIKEFDYVYTVVDTWRKQIDNFYKYDTLIDDNRELYKVFNRDFTNGFLKGDISKDMFIDNPMSHSTKRHNEINDYNLHQDQQVGAMELYGQKAETREQIKEEINQLSIEKVPLIIAVSGKPGEPLIVNVQTPEFSFSVDSKVNLAGEGTEALNEKMILKRFKAFNETEYYIKCLDLSKLEDNVYIPFKELNSIKKRVLFILNDSKEMLAPVAVPTLTRPREIEVTPTLSVLISSLTDLNFCNKTDATIYYQLPNGFKEKCDELVDLFHRNKKLIPWFPAVLIGDDYDAAVGFLRKVNPKKIVTNNTGIAFEAYRCGMRWIAGPFLNTVNSFSLLALKENFNCSGAFISNELSKVQIRNIKKPDDFELYYSIYHPIILMTSRQCLFHQVAGCAKNRVDNKCIQNCVKAASITNLKNVAFYLEKSEANLHNVYNETNFLNTEIVRNIPNFFSGFLIDLRDIKTETKIGIDKSELISLFESCINADFGAAEKLNQIIQPNANKQYLKGI